MVDAGLSPSATERVTSQALQDAEDGSPVVTVIAKRLRAAKKRLGKIELIEAKAVDKINKDQEETLRTKPKTVATIEELERLIPLLEAAKEEETKAAVSKAVEKALADERARVAAEAPDPQVETDAASKQPLDEAAVASLLKLLYFSQTFDLWRVSGPLAKLERDACLSHYKYHAFDQGATLSEEDLQMVCKLGGLMLMRRTDEPISHDEALQEAQSLALKWLQRSDKSIPSIDGASMEHVSAIVDKVMSTAYMTVRPILSSGVSEDHAPVPEAGYDHQAYSAQHAQGRPMTPDLRQQEIYAPQTGPSPPSQESSFSHYPEPAPTHDPSYFQGNGYSQGPHYPHDSQQMVQEYSSDHMGHQDHMGGPVPNGPASQQLPPEQGATEPYGNYMHSGSIRSDGHDSSAQQHHHSQQPQAYVSGSLDGSQANGEDSAPNAYSYSDPTNASGVRQRGEGGRSSNYRGGYRGRRGRGGMDGPPQGFRGRGRGEYRGRGRGEAGRGRGDFERGSRGRGPPRYPDQGQQY